MTTLETQLQEAIQSRYDALGRAAQAERRAIVAETECARLRSQRRILAHHLRLALLDTWDLERELAHSDKMWEELQRPTPSFAARALATWRPSLHQVLERLRAWKLDPRLSRIRRRQQGVNP